MSEELRILRKEELRSHDCYQFSYAHCFDPEHYGPDCFWREDALYLEDSHWGMGVLLPAITQVLPGFIQCGYNRISLPQWHQIQALLVMEHPRSFHFFRELREWLDEGNRGADYFWILGF